MLGNRFTSLVGCLYPIQQAGMGAGAPPGLAAAVSEAGALGMLGTARPGLAMNTLRAMLDAVEQQTSKPYGVNFILAGDNPPAPELFALAARRARVVEFFYGQPSRMLVELVHDAGALVDWQVGSCEDAVAAAEAGCDFIVAQGIEAGGHVRGSAHRQELLAEVRAAVDIPVLTAGGIGTGREVAAALAAGADGVRMGTRFIAAREANAHPRYVDALIAAEADDTVYTDAFAVSWPGAPHRVLLSSLEAAQALTSDVVAETGSLDGTRVPVWRFQPMVADRETTGAIAALPLWAGRSVGAVKGHQSAREIIEELLGEAETWSPAPND